MKKDKYFRARGGTAKVLNISCAKCGKHVLRYQKDGIGYLHRCYLNRILWPTEISLLENYSKPNDIPNLYCECGEIIGIPMLYKDGRLAYRLERGKYSQKATN